MSALNRNQENAVRGKQKDSVQKENACSLRHDDSKRGKKTQIVLSCSKVADTKMAEENLRKARKRPKIASKELVRIHHVIIGIPYVKITKHNRDAKFGEKCVFMHREADSQPCRKPKKSV